MELELCATPYKMMFVDAAVLITTFKPAAWRGTSPGAVRYCREGTTLENPMNRSLLIASCVLFAALTPVAAQADSPREFLHHALEGDNSEIMLGRLAADRARNPRVRDYGQTLASDHAQARQEVVEVGRRFGLQPNREPAPEARDEREKLTGMRGREFDYEFVRYMIDDHRKDISDFRSEARENHGAVSDLARSQLPTLRKHLELAMSLDRASGSFDNSRANENRDNNDRGDRGDRADDHRNSSDRNNGDYRR
jgi:putative membrane protein